MTAKPKPAIPSPMPWSYSRLTTYEACPRKFYFNVVEKRKEPPNEYMERGSALHAAAEAALAKPRSRLPQDLMRLKAEFDYYRGVKARPEVQHTFTDGLRGLTGWFDGDAWLRVKVDVEAKISFAEARAHAGEAVDGQATRKSTPALSHGIHVGDWKSGQYKPEKAVDQLELYALTEFLVHRDAAFVLTSLHYIDVGKSVHSYWDNPRSVARLKAKWLKRVAPLQRDRAFKARPTAGCKWCFFSRTVGGPCKSG